ncbi:MAG: hypothetical protein AAGA20_10115 [Planctomycetota bacterium]
MRGGAVIALLVVVLALGFAAFATRGRAVSGVERVDGREAPTNAPLDRERLSLAAPLGDTASIVEVETSEDRVVLEGTSRLTVRVKSHGQAVARASVRIVIDGTTSIDLEPGRTSARGRVRFTVPANRDVQVEVRPSGAEESLTVATRTPEVSGSKTLVVDVSSMPSRYSIELDVRSSPSGRPIPHARITVRADKEGAPGRTLDRGSSNATGLAAVAWRPESWYVVDADGHARRHVRSGAERPDGPLRIDVFENAQLHGELALNGDEQAESRDARVWIRLPPVEAEGESARSPQHVVRARQIVRQHRVDEDARWSIDGIEFRGDAPVHEGVEVYARVGSETRLVARGLIVRAGDDLEVVDLFAHGPPFRAQVLYPDGTECKAAFSVVIAEPDSQGALQLCSVEVSSRGILDVPTLPEGVWDLHIGSFDDALDPQPIARIDHVGARSRPVVLEGVVPLRGRVVGGPEGPFLMCATESGERFASGAQDGSFDLGPVRAGEESTISAAGFSSVRPSTTVFTGGTRSHQGSVSLVPAQGKGWWRVIADGADVQLTW